MQELKASKKLSKSQAHAGGSSKGTGISPGVPDESTDILTTSSEGTGTKPGVPDEVNSASKAKADSAINWGSEEESEYSEEGIVNKEFVHGDEYVHDDVDEEMKDVEDTETGKDDDEITDAEKTEVTKGDREQSRKLPESVDTEINSLLDIQIQQEFEIKEVKKAHESDVRHLEGLVDEVLKLWSELYKLG
ncbi:hypothetical protein Tco_0435790 [Tanacetum coccineum]